MREIGQSEKDRSVRKIGQRVRYRSEIERHRSEGEKGRGVWCESKCNFKV